LGYFEICQLITENIEVKNPTTIEDLTPLHLAALNGSFDVCKLIIDYGVDKHPNFADSTPLQLAARKRHLRD
jgi:ankyrin repeat protein